MRFFFYGTLIAGSGNAASDAVHAKLRCLGEARLHGRLYAIPDPRGWYPALLPGAGEVHGLLYEALPHMTRWDLARIDAYEDFDPASPRESLYRRVTVRPVTEHGVSLAAMAYLYNRSLPRRARRIGDGDFGQWLARTGARVFRA